MYIHIYTHMYMCISMYVPSCKQMQAEPALLEPGGDDADHEWVGAKARVPERAQKTLRALGHLEEAEAIVGATVGCVVG